MACFPTNSALFDWIADEPYSIIHFVSLSLDDG